MKTFCLRKIFLWVFLMSFFVGNNIMASVKSYQKQADGVLFSLDKGLMKLKICSPNIVNVKYTVFDSLSAKNSLVVVNKWTTPTAFSIFETGNEVVIATSELKVKVNKSNNAITYTDLKDAVVLAEDADSNKVMKYEAIAGIPVYTCGTTFLSPADEALYGLGCHPQDTHSINYKGRDQTLLIKYMTGAIPVLVSNKGYGLMWDNYSPSYFYGTEDNNTKYKYTSENGKMIDYYFFFGPDMDKVIASYRKTTGEAPMFPKWAFGLFQSQDRYKSQAEVLSVKDGYRDNRIPVDVIVQDWFYWEPDLIGSHILYPERYPNPKAMVDELHKANIHAMISIWPVFAEKERNYESMAKNGYLTTLTWNNCMTSTQDWYYDAHNPKARDMYWRLACDERIKPDGWDAWWVDQCEPDNDGRLDERRQCVFQIGRGIDYFNTYSLMHSTGLYEHWRKDIQGKRAFFLIRQSFAGEQRNGATLWSSDITCTWKAFTSQVPQGINACASGIPYWTSDIGGYHLNWKAPDWSTPNNRALFTRWFQFGAFSPIFRIHGKGERAIFSKNWDEKTRAILLKYDNLRYRLLPYNYSLGWKVSNEGYTIMRNLVFDFRTDPNTQSIPDQYMYGPAFLVNPVTDSLTTGTRKLYLPTGTKWYDFWTGKAFAGGQTINASAPIETMPLYVRAGSVVPMSPFVQYAEEKTAEPMEIRIYAGADGSFTLYSDENDTYNYEKGAYATVAMQWNDKKKTLTIDDRKGSFPGMETEQKFNIVLVSQSDGTGIDIAKNPVKSVVYTGKKMIINVK